MLAGAVGQTREDQQTHQCEDPRDGCHQRRLEAELLAGDGGHLGGQEERDTVDRDLEAEIDQREVLTIVGPRPGDGQALKAINQLLAGIHIAAAAEAIALARGLGLDPAVVIEALSQGAAGSFMFADRGPRMLQAYTGGAEVKSRVDIFVKDMGIVTTVGRTSHVPLPLAAAAQQLYLIAEAAGLGAHDDSSVVTILSPKKATDSEQ